MKLPPDISLQRLALNVYTRSGLKSELARMTHGSPLRAWRVGIVAAIVLPIGCILMLLNSSSIRQGAPFSVYFVALIITSAAAYPAQWLLRRLDTFEPEPWWLLDGAKWYSSALGLGVAAVLGFTVEGVLTLLFGQASASALKTVFLTPLVAEATKGIAVLLLVWLLRNEFDGVRDGVLYGAYVGLGYLVAVTMVTLVRAYLVTDALSAANIILWRFALLGLSEHTLWTALFGASVGLAMQTEHRWIAVAAPVGGFLLALLANILHQLAGVGAFVQALSWLSHQPASFATFGMIPPGEVWVTAAGSMLVVQLPFYALLAFALLWAGRWERRLLERELRPEIGTPSLTEAEYSALLAGGDSRPMAPREWIISLRERRLTQELIASRRRQQVRWLQAELAFRKWRVARAGGAPDEDQVVTALRTDIAIFRPTDDVDLLRLIAELVEPGERA